MILGFRTQYSMYLFIFLKSIISIECNIEPLNPIPAVQLNV